MLRHTFPPVPIKAKKMKKEMAMGLPRSPKESQRLGYNPRVQWVSAFIMLSFMIANFYITFEYYVNHTGKKIAAKIRRSGLRP